jgi:hypothetical protein
MVERETQLQESACCSHTISVRRYLMGKGCWVDWAMRVYGQQAFGRSEMSQVAVDSERLNGSDMSRRVRVGTDEAISRSHSIADRVSGFRELHRHK